MSRLVLLSVAQMKRLAPHFPRPRGLARVDDRRVINGIVYVIRNGLQWKDAPPGYGPHKTLYNRFIRWSRLGVCDRLFAVLVGEAGVPERPMINSIHLKAHRIAARLLEKGDRRIRRLRCIGRTRGDLNSKLYAVCGGHGRPIVMMLTQGQMNDHKGAALLLPVLPPAVELLGDRRYDSDVFREGLRDRVIEPCIPPTKTGGSPRPTTRPSTGSVIAFRMHSADWKTGDASPPAVTAARTPSFRQSASRPPLHSGCRNES